MRMQRYTFVGTSILASLAALLIGAVYPAAAQEKLNVVMDWLPSWKQSPFHLAKVKGWYEQAGLDVQVDDGNGSTVVVSQVALGKYDLGLASLSIMAVARGKGTDVVAVAGILHKNDLGFFIDKKKGIKDAKDLVGKKLSVIYEAQSFPTLVPLFFKNIGVKEGDITWLPMSSSASYGAYYAGSGDGLVTTVPYLLPIMETKRPSNYFMFADYDLPLPAHGLVVSPKTLEKRPDAVRRFLAVTDRAWRQLWYGNPAEAIDALAAQRPQANIDKAIELKRVEAYKPFSMTPWSKGKSVLWMPPQNWEAAIKVMTAAQLIPANSKPEDFYTNAFVPGS